MSDLLRVLLRAGYGRRRYSARATLITLPIMLILWLVVRSGVLSSDRGDGPRGPMNQAGVAAAPATPVDVVRNAWRNRESDVLVEVGGVVHRMLADDNDGSRHQRFILEIDRDFTVLVAHNIDLAPRVPIALGDPIMVSGEYEWNEQGGVIHWTHHDPAGRRAGGWIEHLGDRYE